MANALFNSTREGFLARELDWNTAVIKVALVRNYTFNPAHVFVSNVTGAGGVIHATSSALTGATVTNGVVDANDVLFPSPPSNSSNHGLLIFQSSAVTGGADLAASAQRVIAWIDSGSGFPIVPNAGDVTVTWSNDANKIFNLAPAGGNRTVNPVAIVPGLAFGVLSVSNPGVGGTTITHGRDIPAAAAAGIIGRRSSVPITQNITNGGVLTVTEAYLASWPGRVIKGIHFQNGSGLQPGPGVAAFTVEDCIFSGPCTWRVLNFGADALGYSVARSMIRNCTFTGDLTGEVPGSSNYSMLNGGPFDFQRNIVRGYMTGVQLWTNGPGTIIENYITDLIINPGAASHTNAVLNPGYSGWTIDRNWLENYTEGNNSGGGPSASLATYNEPGTALNGGFVRDNVFDGGSFSFYGGATGQAGVQAINLVVTGNQFNRGFWELSGTWGPAVAFDETRTGNVWSNNTWGPIGVGSSPPDEGTIIVSPGPG